MALVAYGSSDESGYSEEEESPQTLSERTKNSTVKSTVPSTSKDTTTSDKFPTPTATLLDVDKLSDSEEVDGASQISDEEDFSLSEGGGTIGLSLPAPRNVKAPGPAPSFNTESGSSTTSSEANLLAGLPKPKAADIPNIISEKEDVLEDFVKKKEIVVEKPPAKKRLPVKITIPSLSMLDSDEEEEEDAAPKKKKARSSSGTGLLGFLPPPQHVAIKEVNRSFVPHTLTKKPATKPTTTTKPMKPLTPIPSSSLSAPSFAKPSSKSVHLPGVPEDDSDDEEGTSGGGNFFSLGQSSKPSSLTTTSALSSTSYMSKIASTIQSRPMDISAPATSVSASDTPIDSESHSSASLEEEKEYLEPSDAPLAFKPRPEASNSHWGRMQGRTTGLSASQMYNLANAAEEDVVEDDAAPSTSSGSAGDFGGVELTEEQMIRLTGKRKGKIDIANIRDVHQADQIDEQAMLKALSEDDGQTAAYAAHRAEQEPGGQSKRKHQITYLGHMAKARELELKNQWSQNKMTKKQSAMKYGF